MNHGRAGKRAQKTQACPLSLSESYSACNYCLHSSSSNKSRPGTLSPLRVMPKAQDPRNDPAAKLPEF